MSASLVLKKKEEIFKFKDEQAEANIISQENNHTKNKPLMILGPSGVGKDTLTNMLKKKYPSLLKKCVSNTTRKIRTNEKEGVNYFYISEKQFKELESKNELIGIFKKYDIFYGTSKKVIKEALKEDKIVYFDYNIETAIKINEENDLEFNYIAIILEDIGELEKRLRHRGTEDEETIKKRMAYAPEELKLIKKSKFINFVIKNDKLDDAFKDFELCIQKLYPQMFK